MDDQHRAGIAPAGCAPRRRRAPRAVLPPGGVGAPGRLGRLAHARRGRLGPADEPRESWCWIASNSGPAVNRTSTLLAAAGGGEEAPTAANGDGPHVVAGAVPFVSDGGGSSTRYLQLLLFYFPLLLAFVFNLTVYLRVGAAFARMARDGAVEASRSE